MQYRDFYHRDKVGERDIVDLDDSFPQRWIQCYDKALYILSLKLITTHTLSCNFNNTIELC